jgi:tetratricopeptide (TPR) repeat protein
MLILCCIVALAACNSSSREKVATKAGIQSELPDNIREQYRLATAYPDSVALRLQLVDALDSIGASKPALAQMDSLISRDSLNYGFWYRKALLQQNDKDTAGALRSFRYAIRIYPSPDALLSAANLLAEKQDSTALLLAKQVLQQNLGREYNAHGYFISGVYYARTGQQKKALDAFNACLYNDLTYMEAYMEKGFIYYDSGAFKEAEKVFKTAVQVKNTYADGFYWLAKTQEALHDKAGAVMNYQRAQSLDPSIKEAAAAIQRLK